MRDDISCGWAECDEQGHETSKKFGSKDHFGDSGTLFYGIDILDVHNDEISKRITFFDTETLIS